MPSRASIVKWLHDAWPYLALLIIMVLPLLLIAAALAVRSNLFSFSGSAPSSEQLKVFMAFIGGGLATAATVLASLLTWQHNKRAERHLQLETVVKGLESLPEGEPRVAGAIATMVLLGHQAVAMRILAPAWKKGTIDSPTATWLIGQVLCADQKDENAINEAASTLLMNAAKLTNEEEKGYISVPGSCFTKWHTDVPAKSRRIILAAIAETLLSQEKSWWMTDHKPMAWPATILAEAMNQDSDPGVRACASVLLHAVFECFPTLEFSHERQSSLGTDVRQRVKENAEAVTEDMISAMYWILADKIRAWGGVSQPVPLEGPAGAHVLAV